MEHIQDLYQQWADSFAAIGSSHISIETAAKILAVLEVYGGSHENFTHNKILLTDIKAAQRMFRLYGGEIPDTTGVALIKQYIDELNEDIEESNTGEDDGAIFSKVCHVEWANRLFINRYGFKKLML